MPLMSSMYDKMSDDHQRLMEDNQQHLADMLDFAINKLVEVCEENETMLVDNKCVCTTYNQIFDCLKHWSQKRQDYNCE